MDTAMRLFELLALLHARPVWSGEALAERLGVTRRTVRRDIARLRALDHPVEAVPGPHGGYRLGRGDDLPPLVLDDSEALAVVLGLRAGMVNNADGLADAAVSALAKLERVLPSRLADRLRDIADATVAVGTRPEIPSDPGQLLILAQACRRRERVRFMYTARDDERSMRLADPFRLVHAARRWYLVAFDLDRVDWRTFRVDRLSSAFATGDACEPRPEPDAEQLVRAALGFAPYPVQARVRLHVPVDVAATLVPATVGLTEPDGDDATLLRVGGTGPAGMARWLASFPCRIEVLEPDELRDALLVHLRTLTGSA